MTTSEGVTFGRRLRELRKDRDMTLVDLAELLGTSHQRISGWEGDKHPPKTRSLVVALEEALEAEGELLPLLGYATGPELTQQVASLRRRIELLEETVSRLAEQLAPLGAPQPTARARRGKR